MATGTTSLKTLSIPVSGELRAFVEERVSSGRYETVSEYVRALIRADQEAVAKLQAWRQVEAKLLEGLESGEAEPIAEEFWEDLRRRASGEMPR